MDYLDKEFDGRVLALGADLRGLRGQSWAPRSPDLSVLDFAVWAQLKRIVFSAPLPTTIDELVEKIADAISELNTQPDYIRRCHLSVRKRAQLCIDQLGGHFEFLK